MAGRPKVHPREKKTVFVQFKISVDDWYELVKASEASGLRLAAWVRQSAVEKAKVSLKQGKIF